ncbi:hypothetical protein EYR38_004855 [Pleurotus pulmonarius]|nr:hypothetical protein EYR38_004855 [Pleurotus pulmonarius]
MSDCEEALKLIKVEILNTEELQAFIQGYPYMEESLRTEDQARVLVLAPLFLGTLFEVLLFGILVAQISWTSFVGSFILTIAISTALSHMVTDGDPFNFELETPDPCPKAALAMIAFRKRYTETLQPDIAGTARIHFNGDHVGEAVTTVATPIWMSLSIACDMTITLSMIILMYRALKEAIFRTTRQTLSKILRFTLETGLLTTTLIVTQMVLMLALNPKPGGGLSGVMWRYIFFYPTGVVYSSWLLASLNARSSMANHGSLVINTVPDLQSTRSRDVQARAHDSQPRPVPNVATGDGNHEG